MSTSAARGDPRAGRAATAAAASSCRRRARDRAAGTPEDVARVKESCAEQYLRDLLGRRAKAKRQAVNSQEPVSRQWAPKVVDACSATLATRTSSMIDCDT